MALNAYLALKGQQQGQIKGSVIQKGRENQIAVYGFMHEITSPRDASSGLATGKRQHRPLLITKEIDKSSPLLMKALVSNENITEFILNFYAPIRQSPSGSGNEAHIYSIRLINAFISGIDQDMSLNKVEPGISLPVLESVSFVYQKIEWTWVEGGHYAQDDWNAPTT